MLRKLLLVFCLVCGCLQVAAQGKLSNVKVEDADGKLVEISSLVNGKPFIMSFWGITCKPCLMELNAINDQLEEWQEEVDFEVVAVSIDDSLFSTRARSMASGSGWYFICVCNLYSAYIYCRRSGEYRIFTYRLHSRQRIGVV